MKKLVSLVGVTALVLTMFVAGGASAAQVDETSDRAVVAVYQGPSLRAQTRVANATVDPAALGGASTMAYGSYTHYWGARNGWWTLNLSGLPVTPRQAVVVSASEVDGGGNEFIGATITVHNVAVWNGGASIKIYVDWGSPIYINVHYVW
ncbi:hypothetical protein [Micromonospora echinofusca]|uniref:Uncharacterized protein n=1 Tax=Micromonospora echinofusca TaxID=47858 RepID=A0ABS3VJI0_MICEH|nr:hypothetical protein [Micromonospora echinofusca]MBO4204603.1 hypothetical protein [Micromonospora echinofusca]